MSSVRIPALPPDLEARLRARAARAGRSVEAEVIAILDRVAGTEVSEASAQDLQSFVAGLYGGRLPSEVVEDLLRERRLDVERG